MTPAARIAVVTGGGTGIGKAIAAALIGEGFQVVLTGRREAVLAQAVADLGGDDAGVSSFAADIADPSSVAGLFDLVRRRFGRLDLLVNNAGAGAPAVPLEEISFEQWNAVVGSNLTGAFLATQEAFRIMKSQTPQGGRIINNGSLSAETPRPNSAPYTATKHAILGLTKATALDGRPFNIACGQIDIGNAATDMTAAFSKGVLQANGDTAAEPTVSVDHIGRAVAYMATLPIEANVLRMTVMATQMPFVGRG